MTPIIIIPARMASSRLPGKPLADIAGKPMILHVVNKAMIAGLGPVVVAASDKKIVDVVKKSGAEAILTPAELPSGSDRVWYALQQVDSQQKYDVVINLQGDLPSILPSYLSQVLLPLEDISHDIGTLVTEVKSPEEAAFSSVVKVACHFRPEGNIARALYFSRQPIPWGEGYLWHHIGIYSYRRSSLGRFVSSPPSGLELRERLEQLRALELGMVIGCSRVPYAPFGVDTEEDLARIRISMSVSNFQ